MIEITNEDNMDLMSRYPDNYFDLAIVDPPYGIDAPNMQMGANKSKNKSNTSDSVANKLKKARFSQGSGKLKDRKLNTMKLDWDIKPDDKYFKELFRVSKNQIVWGGNYFIDNLYSSRGFAIWNKNQPWDNFSQAEFAWASFDAPSKLITLSNRGGANTEEKIHPTQKPVKLYEWLLMNYAKEGDKILDTHLGSGSIAIACHNLGFDLTACELDKDYYEAAMKRLHQHQSQLTMF